MDWTGAQDGALAALPSVPHVSRADETVSFRAFGRGATLGGVVVVDDFVAKPILRWVGGKQYLIRELLRSLPLGLRGLGYIEPFLGAASLFVAIRPPRARLSDLNGHLIEAYRAIRDHPDLVADLALSHAHSDSEAYYYSVRDDYNSAQASPERAAQFLYLNRSCFNGVFRVNRRGAFNVPYGHKQRLLMPSRSGLRALAGSLESADLRVAPYQDALQDAAAGDFIYLDPPYPPLNGTAFFTHYTKERFAGEDQEELATLAGELRARGCLVLVSNADTPVIRELYDGWNIRPIRVAFGTFGTLARARAREVPILPQCGHRLRPVTYLPLIGDCTNRPPSPMFAP